MINPNKKNLSQARIVFFGTPDFAIPSLHALTTRGHVVGVVTQPDKPVGRSRAVTPPPIKREAIQHGLPVFQPDTVRGNETFFRELAKLSPDYLVVVAYGKIIPDPILSIAPAINVHPSLLPELRGPSPIQTAILQGKSETGISIMLLDAEMDHGPIIAQEKIELLPDEYFPEAEARIARRAADILVESLDAYGSGLLTPHAQAHERATYCALFTKEIGQISWHAPARDIYNHIRALQPWPGTWTSWDSKQLLITRARIYQETLTSSAPGTTFVGPTGELMVRCAPGVLVIERAHLAGKKDMSSIDLLRGYPTLGMTQLQ